MKTHFMCPLCKELVEIRNSYLMAYPDVERQDIIGLKNKRFHMAQHREVRRKEEKEQRKIRAALMLR